MHMKFVRALVLCALGVSVGLVAGCNKADATADLTITGPSAPPTLSISPSTGEAVLNNVNGLCEAPAQFTVVPQTTETPHWTISGPAGATISASGLARAVRAGIYVVRVTVGSLSASATLVVREGGCTGGEEGPTTGSGPGNFALSRVSCDVVDSGRRAEISWTASSGATGYRMERRFWTTGPWTREGETTDRSFIQEIGGNDAKSATYYRVFAIGANGMETKSSPEDLLVCEEAREEPPLVPPPPPPPPPPTPPTCPTNPDFEVSGRGVLETIVMVKGQLLNVNVINWPSGNACNPFWFSEGPDVVAINGSDTFRNIGGANYYAGPNAVLKAIYQGSKRVCVQGDVGNNYHPGCHLVQVVMNSLSSAFGIGKQPEPIENFRRLRYMDRVDFAQTYTPKN